MTDPNDLNSRLQNEISERLRAEEELKRRTALLTTLLDVSNLVSSSMELKPLLEAILDRLRKILDYKDANFFIVDGNRARILACKSVTSRDEEAGPSLPASSIPLGARIVTQRKPVVIADIHSEDPLAVSFRSDLKENADSVFKNVGSWMGLPMIVKDRVVGVLTLDHGERGFYKPEDVELGMAFANQAAIEYQNAMLGIENARLYQEERARHLEDEQRRYVAEGLRDMLAVLNSHKAVNETMNFIIKEAVRLVGTDSGALYRLNAERDALVLESACGLPDEILSQAEVPLDADPIGKAVSSRKPIVIPDIASQAGDCGGSPGQASRWLKSRWLKENCRGLIALPLICKDEIYGGIALYFKKGGAHAGKKEFSRDMIDLAMTFADQAALVIDNARLRTKAEEMAVAAERNRLARDLHDSVTQTLFSASLIAEVVPKLWQRNPDEGMKRLEELRQLTRGALAEMRTLLFELRPATLVEAALEELLRQLSEAITGRARIPVSLKIKGHGTLATEVKIALYRIAQEALNNIAKHSGAASADVVLEYLDDGGCKDKKTVRLSISDDGKGFDPHTVTSEHLGLGIMRERAEAIGAELNVHSRPGAGTEIVLNFDYSAE